ncbi:MAG: hypothetical protein EOP06_12915 [Proteobacteria bacterium]|nr:MAG: hypothetical protein EOP06_12915 [Pseudomonadota bacterium]
MSIFITGFGRKLKSIAGLRQAPAVGCNTACFFVVQIKIMQVTLLFLALFCSTTGFSQTKPVVPSSFLSDMDSADSIWVVAEFQLCPNALSILDSTCFFKNGEQLLVKFSRFEAVSCGSIENGLLPIFGNAKLEIVESLHLVGAESLRTLISAIISIKFQEPWTYHSSFRIRINNRFSDFQLKHASEFAGTKDVYDHFISSLFGRKISN